MGGLGVLVYGLGYEETLKNRHPLIGPPITTEAVPSVVTRLLADVPNPFGFLRLFHRGGLRLAALTLAWTLSEVCDGTMEIDRHYGVHAVGLSLAQDGVFNSLKGLTSLVGGRFVVPLVVKRATAHQFTLAGNSLGVTHNVLRVVAGTLQSPTIYALSLVPMTLGHGPYRVAIVNAQIMKLALGTRIILPLYCPSLQS